MRILLVGHGRMGRLVEALAPEYDASIAAIVTEEAPETAFDAPADVVIDFSTGAAVAATVAKAAARRLPVVIGTTGWQAHEAVAREAAGRAGIGVVAAPNFAVGMLLFSRLVADAARQFASRADTGAWIHETHHAAKKDAPSGTALALERTMRQAGYDRSIHVSSTRAGSIPGTHVVGFDGPSETVTLTHAVRDRGVFARGALEAAKWVIGRTGWFSIEDVIGEGKS